LSIEISMSKWLTAEWARGVSLTSTGESEAPRLLERIAEKRRRGITMKGRRIWRFKKRSLAILAVYVCMIGPVLAQAHRSPANVKGNGIVININRTPASVLVGGTVTYNVSIANVDDPSISLTACDITNTAVIFYCPGADGNPDFTMPHVLAAS